MQLSDTFSKRSKRHCLLQDTCSCQTLAVARQLQVADICNCQTLLLAKLATFQ